MAFIRGANAVTSGLIVALDAANPKSYPGTGTVWRDLVSNFNSGSLLNGPTFTSADNGLIVFDGSDDYVNCSVNITIASFSMESFVYINSRTSGDIIGSWNDPYKFLWRVNTSGYQLFAWNGGGPSQELIGTDVVDLGVFSHLVVTYDGNNLKYYKNSNLTDTSAKSISIQNFTAMQIGANTYDNAYFDGKIAYAKIYNRALSAQEVSENYNATKSRFEL